MVQIREYKSSDAKGISKFMKRCFLQDVTTEVRSHDAEYYAWKYGKSPWGENVSLVAEDKGNIVGLFCIMPKKIKIGDDTLLIGETGDAYTDPEYQGKGILFKMISLAFNEMKKQNITSFGFNSPW